MRLFSKNEIGVFDDLNTTAFLTLPYYDNTTTIILKNIEALPRDMNASVEIMLELFRDLEKEDGVVLQIIGQEMNEKDISDYII